MRLRANQRVPAVTLGCVPVLNWRVFTCDIQHVLDAGSRYDECSSCRHQQVLQPLSARNVLWRQSAPHHVCLPGKLILRVSLRVDRWLIYRTTFLDWLRRVTSLCFKFLMIYTEKYVVNSVEVWRKVETKNLREKEFVGQDGWLSNSEYSEPECRLAFRSPESPCVYNHTSVLGPPKYNTFNY